MSIASRARQAERLKAEGKTKPMPKKLQRALKQSTPVAVVLAQLRLAKNVQEAAAVLNSVKAVHGTKEQGVELRKLIGEKLGIVADMRVPDKTQTDPQPAPAPEPLQMPAKV